jgi:hypothetical protein
MSKKDLTRREFIKYASIGALGAGFSTIVFEPASALQTPSSEPEKISDSLKERQNMKILAIGKPVPGATEEKIYAHVKEEVGRGWELYASGIFREMYSRPDGGGVVLILECADVEEAKKVLDTLPLVKAGLVNYDIIPLGPFTLFSVLFAQEGQEG